MVIDAGIAQWLEGERDTAIAAIKTALALCEND